MRKVLSFSLFLMLGLIVSQLLPGTLGAGYAAFKKCSDTLLYICLGFIMINVGREFEIDKTRWRSYTADYFIAMATAALPWILIVLYYVFALLPPELWTSGEAWKENLLLSRFAAPTSAGILFTMLAALSLKKSWIYKKIQVLAIFDDLDTILLMIPLQILMTGLRWQMFAIIAVVTLLLAVGWRWQATWNVRQDWKTILGLAVVVCALTQLVLKALVALLFTSRAPRLLCPRNGAALLLACLLSPAAYGLAACLLLGGVNAFWPQFLGTLVQAVGSGAVFAVLALALDRAGGKARLAPHSQG